ncbi:MAG TPA: hypothetical protein VMB47_07860 [Candidatus Aquilonibacter sp.]|nr:hypothetical protein [Candidatus Aquilonibacter sp.]
MTKFSVFGLLLIATLALGAAPARAQVAEAAAVTAPIVIHTITSKKKTTASGNWMKAEFLHADGNSMVVSEQGNERMIHTFTYSDQVKAKMQKIIDAGGYQYGDKIKILYTPGSTVALKIHGKPSKSS